MFDNDNNPNENEIPNPVIIKIEVLLNKFSKWWALYDDNPTVIFKSAQIIPNILMGIPISLKKGWENQAIDNVAKPVIAEKNINHLSCLFSHIVCLNTLKILLRLLFTILILGSIIE